VVAGDAVCTAGSRRAPLLASSTPNYRHGKFTREARELGKFFRQMAKDADGMTASTMHAHGLRPPKPIRRKVHVRKALAAAKARKQEETK